MEVYLYTFVPALIVAVLIRVDAKLVGPYFSTGSLIPGFGGEAASSLTKSESLRFALIRRIAYPVLMGLVLYFLRNSPLEALLAGLMGGFLLAWPAWIAPQPPMGMTLRDVRYHAFYVLFILTAGALSLIGHLFGAILVDLSDGDLLGFLAENVFLVIATFLVASVLGAFTRGVGKSLNEKATERVQSFEPEDGSGADADE